MGLAELLDDWTHPRLLAVLEQGRIGFAGVSFAPEGNIVALGGDDGQTVLWDVADPDRSAMLASMGGQTYRTTAVPFSPGGRVLVTATPTPPTWDVSDPTRPRKLATFDDENSTYSGVFSPSGRTLAVMRGRASSVYAAGFSPDGKVLATGGYDKTAIFWDVTDPHNPRELTSIRGHASGVGPGEAFPRTKARDAKTSGVSGLTGLCA